MKIEAATLEDLPALAPLLARLAPQHDDAEATLARRSAGLRLLLESPQLGTVLVGRAGADVLAMVTLVYTVSTTQGGRAAFLEEMIVHPGVRDRGLGTLLLEAAVAHCEAAGCARITLLTPQENVGALRFYGRQGFTRSPAIPLGLSLAG